MVSNYIENLQKAVKNIRIADHMAYITYPVIKDKRLLLNILEQTSSALVCIINAILQYEYFWKRIQLYKDVKSNFQTFSENCAPRYGIGEEQVSEALEILLIAERHKKSAIEFARKDKIVIMTDNLKTKIVDLEKIREYILLSKKMFEKASVKITQR